jgi:hypothetical protein
LHIVGTIFRQIHFSFPCSNMPLLTTTLSTLQLLCSWELVEVDNVHEMHIQHHGEWCSDNTATNRQKWCVMTLNDHRRLWLAQKLNLDTVMWTGLFALESLLVKWFLVEERLYKVKNLCLCHFFNHILHVEWSEIEPGYVW